MSQNTTTKTHPVKKFIGIIFRFANKIIPSPIFEVCIMVGLCVAGAFAITALCFLIVSPFMVTDFYFKGKANQAYLQKTKGIDMPWYQAAYISIDTNNVQLEIK